MPPSSTIDALYEPGGSLLTRAGFQFALEGEVKRAARSGEPLTVLAVTIEPTSSTSHPPDAKTQEIAAAISGQIRDTDLIGRTAATELSVVLIDSDDLQSPRVVNRIVRALERLEAAAGLRIAIGAASYPIHAIDSDALTRHARAHVVARLDR